MSAQPLSIIRLRLSAGLRLLPSFLILGRRKRPLKISIRRLSENLSSKQKDRNLKYSTMCGAFRWLSIWNYFHLILAEERCSRLKSHFLIYCGSVSRVLLIKSIVAKIRNCVTFVEHTAEQQ